MRKHKNLIFYVLTVIVFFLLISFILTEGEKMSGVTNLSIQGASGASNWAIFICSLFENISHPLALLLMQIVAILLVVRLFGFLCSKIGQPVVIGEIIAGIVLGPSLLGTFFPELSNAIFPESSLSNIEMLSQIGLVLFMFIVGMELDLKVLKNRANDAVLISHASILFPYALGIILSYFIYDHFTHEQTHFIPFALFMGIAMSITAFPVLARIVHERGLHRTPLGAMTITCAAIDDVTAWCILAAVIAIAKAGSFISSLYVIALAVIYIFVMFKLIRPFLKRIADLQTSRKIIGKTVVALFFLVLFLSAYLTEIIGIHALFGAFLAGVIIPENINFRKLFIEKIEDVSLILLLPLFFVYTGLRTEIGLLNEPYLWIVCFAIIFVAVTGKFVGSALAARFVGLNWHSSFTLGALMNTRGLMELVVLNIGLDLGILTPEVFAMMVVMALITTFMTSPILNLIDKFVKNREEEIDPTENQFYRILIPFGDSNRGRKLLMIANAFVKKKQSTSQIDMVHFSPGNNLYQYNMEEEEHDRFQPLLEDSKRLNQPINPIFEVAPEPFSRILKMTNRGNYNLLLLGAPGAVFNGDPLGLFFKLSNTLFHVPSRMWSWIKSSKRSVAANSASLGENIRSILLNSNAGVGIFIDKGLTEVKNVFVPILDENDIFIGDFMEQLSKNSYVRITLWDSISLMDTSIEFVKSVRGIQSINPYLFQMWNNNISMDGDIFGKNDLIMISLKSWTVLKETHPSWIESMPSVLLLNE